MEKKTTQRIIGILVVIALVIILLPLMVSKNDTPSKSATNEPPFPDQQIKQSPTPDVATANQTNQTNAQPTGTLTNKDQINQVPADTIKPVDQMAQAQPTPIQPQTPSAAHIDPAKPIAAEAQDSVAAQDLAADPNDPNGSESLQSSGAKPVEQIAPEPQGSATPPRAVKAIEKQPVDKSQQPQPQEPRYSIISDTAKTESVQNEQIAEAFDIKPAADAEEEPVLSNISTAKPQKHKQMKSAATTQPKYERILPNLKKTAWVVQLGSFKDKSNARRLADKLRAKGFKAFIHEVKSKQGSTQTRVYIGPEYKHVAAIKLSMKIENQTKMHGYIVQFKPLEL